MINNATNAEIEDFLKHILAFSAMSNMISQNNTIATQKRMQTINYSAEKRYEEFVKNLGIYHFLNFKFSIGKGLTCTSAIFRL